LKWLGGPYDFEAIHMLGLKEQEVIDLMRAEMKPSSFRMWRARVQGRKTNTKTAKLHRGTFKMYNAKTNK
jgi:uncharacterized protein (TIGR03643 family)